MDEPEGVTGREEAPAPAPAPASAAAPAPEEDAGDGFQLVTHGKKKKRAGDQEGGSSSGSDAIQGSGSARALTKDKAAALGTKAKVPFHDPSIPRPQEVYKIIVDNYKPFKHVWLEHSEDGTRPVHPLEKLPVEQFIDRNVCESEPVRPADLEDTPFTLVDDPQGLKELSKKLKSVTEFAVDLEHNQYRSFQGLTCLMQISTRTEDFIVDTLKLRIYIGLYLQEHFKDPTKRKVMHGADRDIMWLQRDFHIYVCNLFDTGQASRVLQMERNSLEYLLHHFCGVTAKKEYQNADWRARPLPDEMIKYAREDTHYLLYIYDLMRQKLQKESTSENDLLLEVHKRSNEICLQFYEKEVLTDKSYLHIYGLQEHELNAKQLAVVAALHNWRDGIARQEDESTGYILPNKALLEIAKQMPPDVGHLKRIVKSKYPFVESHLNDIVATIRNALKYSHLFEGIPEQLKKERLEQSALRNIKASDEMTRLDADIDRSNICPADQSSMAPSSTANFLAGLNRPMNNEFLSNNRYQQGGSNVENFNTSVLPFQQFSGANIMPKESLYPVSGMYSDDFWIQSAQMGEVMQLGDTAYYPQFAGYNSEVDSHYEPESMHMSGYLSGFDPGINQRGTGTGQPHGNVKERTQPGCFTCAL
ncbi:hypothetical protein QOZ80_3BG0293720 [Eleusine coracana subsp. coracana]|nr:hypothetical protein QOZ80_3BG0293720 [Eleusine coracana subsp. coracana]